MEKMKGCQHTIITWAPGVGGFSVRAETSLPFLLSSNSCFPKSN